MLNDTDVRYLRRRLVALRTPSLTTNFRRRHLDPARLGRHMHLLKVTEQARECCIAALPSIGLIWEGEQGPSQAVVRVQVKNIEMAEPLITIPILMYTDFVETRDGYGIQCVESAAINCLQRLYG